MLEAMMRPEAAPMAGGLPELTGREAGAGQTGAGGRDAEKSLRAHGCG